MTYNPYATGSPNQRELTPEEYRDLNREIQEKRMTNACNCKAEHWQPHAESCPAANRTNTSTYETVDRIRNTHRHAQPNPAENPAWANCHMDCGILLAEIEQLRVAGKILVEEGDRHLTEYNAEIERLRNDCQELTCGDRKFVSSDTLRRELTGDVPDGQYAAVLKEAEKGEPVNTLDLIDALWWRVRNQRREIAKLHEKHRASEPLHVGVKCSHCDGKGRLESYYDEDSGWMEEIPCTTCGGSGRIRTVEQYLKTLPADWHEDNSLQTWFPLTSESLERQERLIDALVPFSVKGDSSIQDMYNARKALGLDPYDDAAAEGLVSRSVSRSQRTAEQHK